MTTQRPVSVKIVGVCASGKSTLGYALHPYGYTVYPCAQEHSYVPDLWRRRHPADILIYLDARADTIAQRRRTAEPRRSRPGSTASSRTRRTGRTSPS